MSYCDDVLPSDNMLESTNKIINAHTANKAVIIVGECTVDFNGRAWTYLDEGRRTVRINPSGAVVVSGTKSVKPKNWQTSDAKTEIDIDDDNHMIIRSKSSNPKEILEIRFTSVYKSIHYSPPENDVEVEGTEDDLHKKLISNPEYIENGLKILEHEKTINTGDIDLFGIDNIDNEVIIEVKRKKAQIENVDQLNRYMNTYDSDKAVRGILVAPDITESAEEYLKNYQYEFSKIDIAKIFDKK